jgi:hypothetical protein
MRARISPFLNVKSTLSKAFTPGKVMQIPLIFSTALFSIQYPSSSVHIGPVGIPDHLKNPFGGLNVSAQTGKRAFQVIRIISVKEGEKLPRSFSPENSLMKSSYTM